MQQEDEKNGLFGYSIFRKEAWQMNSFVECSIAMQNFLMILGNLPDFGTYSLSVRITCFSGKKKVITAITVFCSSFALMVSLMNEHRYSIGEVHISQCPGYPASIFANSGIVALTFYLCWAIWKERYKYNHSLSYWSVNEAVDDVPWSMLFGFAWKRLFCVIPRCRNCAE